jgi:hypothetical protein
MVRSPALTVDGATRGKCGDGTGHAVGPQMIGVVKIRLLPPEHHLLSTGDRSRRNGSDVNSGQLQTLTEMTPVGRTKGMPFWTGAPIPRDLMRTAPPSCPWQRWRPAGAAGLVKPQMGELFSSTQAQHSSPAGQEIPTQGGAAVVGWQVDVPVSI